jgi:gamma-glutamyltranspeptidase / glutathione hydrolase
MSPTMVFNADGWLLLVVGSPGGNAIINYVARVIVASLDWGLDLQDAIDAPHFGSRNGPTELERGTSAEMLRARLAGMGHEVRVVDMASGTHAVQRIGEAWVGAADPRGEGTTRGE